MPKILTDEERKFELDTKIKEVIKQTIYALSDVEDYASSLDLDSEDAVKRTLRVINERMKQ